MTIGIRYNLSCRTFHGSEDRFAIWYDAIVVPARQQIDEMSPREILCLLECL